MNPPPPPRSPDREAEIMAGRIESLYRHFPVIGVMNLVLPGLIAWSVLDASEPLWLVLWVGLHSLLTGVRFLVVRRYHAAAPGPRDARRWGRIYAAFSGLSGLLWAGSWYLAADDGYPLNYVLMALTGLAAGSVSSLSSYVPAYLAFSLTTISPVVWYISQHSGVASALIPLLFFLAVNWRHSQQMQRAVGTHVALVENRALLEQLAEQKSVAERANFEKSRFLAAASHDLRQPLHALGLYVERLRGNSDPAGRAELISRIGSSLSAVDGLFAALLDISRLDAGVVEVQRRSFPAVELLRQLEDEFRPVALAKGLRLRMMPTRALLDSDPVLLGRILRNLVANALRYSECGGVVVGCRPRGRGVSLEVWDTGIGIPAEEHLNIFCEYHQLGNPERDREKGLGLGLSIVQRLAGLLDHPVGLRSVPGRGSCFSVGVPRAAAATPAAPPADPFAPEGLPPGAPVLVIDDDAAIREAMSQLLSDWGCPVLAVGGPEEALARIAGGAPAPAAVLADYRLREGRSGVEAIAQLRVALGRALPAALITGDTAPERLKEAAASGLPLLRKPVQPARLRALIQRLLREPQPR